MARHKKQSAMFYIHGLYAAGYSQEQVAQLAGVSRGSIVRWIVHGFEPSLPVEMMVANTLAPEYSRLLKAATDNGLSKPNRGPNVLMHRTRLKKKRYRYDKKG